MTREEAVDVLKHNYPSACFTDLCEAVERAIQALSAQPEQCEDAVHAAYKHGKSKGIKKGFALMQKDVKKVTSDG